MQNSLPQKLMKTLKGLKINRFIEDAIIDKLEEYVDVSDLRKLRNESFKPFDKVLKELKTSGKL